MPERCDGDSISSSLPLIQPQVDGQATVIVTREPGPYAKVIFAALGYGGHSVREDCGSNPVDTSANDRFGRFAEAHDEIS
jgi:hypothetical protein